MYAEVFFFIKTYFIPIQQTKDLSQETFSNWQEATCGLNLEYFGATSDRSNHLWGQGIFATKKLTALIIVVILTGQVFRQYEQYLMWKQDTDLEMTSTIYTYN